MSPRSRALAAVVAIVAVSVASADDVATPPPAERVRGIVLSTHGAGEDWAGDAAAATLDDLREVGAGWVSIHPYARIDADGLVRYRPIDPAAPPQHVVRPIREAHARGMKILIKPHLAYWGSPFRWRGEIDFEHPEQWARFWASYGAWIEALARVAHDADGFVVGTELDRTLHHEAAWRELIARVRRATPAALTYGANWSEFERVPFWDALDAIGVHAYFPIDESARPDRARLEAGWARLMARLRDYAVARRRTVVFTELGYNRSWRAAAEPWAYATDGPEAEPFQATCLAVALDAIEREPAVAGVFLWKWFPNPHAVGRNFQLATPALRRTIREAWAAERTQSRTSGSATSSESTVSPERARDSAATASTTSQPAVSEIAEPTTSSNH